VLTRDPITCTMEDDPKDVLRIMNEKGFRHMPVVEYGTLKGLLSIKDVLKFMLEEATYQEKSSVWEQIDFDLRRFGVPRYVRLSTRARSASSSLGNSAASGPPSPFRP